MLMAKVNISWAPFDIRTSKMILVESHFAKVNKTYNLLILSTKFDHFSCENCFLERKLIFGHKCSTICLNHTFSTNCKGKFFFTIKRLRSSKKSFCYKSSILKELLRIFPCISIIRKLVGLSNNPNVNKFKTFGS
jgi:hypothetical protein